MSLLDAKSHVLATSDPGGVINNLPTGFLDDVLAQPVSTLHQRPVGQLQAQNLLCCTLPAGQHAGSNQRHREVVTANDPTDATHAHGRPFERQTSHCGHFRPILRCTEASPWLPACRLRRPCSHMARNFIVGRCTAFVLMRLWRHAPPANTCPFD
jgi:hypothetical protein